MFAVTTFTAQESAKAKTAGRTSVDYNKSMTANGVKGVLIFLRVFVSTSCPSNQLTLCLSSLLVKILLMI